MARVLFLVPLYALAAVGIYYMFLKKPPPVPEVDLNAWWGPTELKGKQDTSIRPFKVTFSESMIKDLRERLNNHRKWTPPLENVGLQYGFNSKQLDSWISYWSERYNFQERERFFNKFPHYKTNIQGLDIHFIRVKPQVPAGVEVVPVLLMHGWPGSVREFYEALPLLTAVSKDRDFAIEAIVPSLPGYGFSDGAIRPGLGAVEVSVVFRNLMQRLGFKKFYAQGGDWGSAVGTSMATLFQDEVLGWHTNFAMVQSPYAMVQMLLGSVLPSLVVEPHLVERLYPLGKTFSSLMEESGYMHIQATKPDTVGVALSDSPSGLMAYILEKFSTGTNPNRKSRADGGLEERFTRDQLIDNLMVYWCTNSITTSVRLYAESFGTGFRRTLDKIPTFVPTWILQARHEIMYQPPTILKEKFPNTVGVTVLQDGGHFIAFEMPETLAADVLKAISAFRKLDRSKLKTEL
ncbi:juvenile hormone epoxide hydrolase-like [Cydia fagiglandana]|uniref:juvenile hormone epoxide hydrolase-like n=1 Tax=Cydia fagiglandana TaxID=1458189 RepID=UPI002FEE417E